MSWQNFKDKVENTTIICKIKKNRAIISNVYEGEKGFEGWRDSSVDKDAYCIRMRTRA